MKEIEKRRVDQLRSDRVKPRRRHRSLRLNELGQHIREFAEQRRRDWRIQRKLDAQSQLLEFCLRPHLALLLYTLSAALLGRGLTHLVSETPYWALWWDEELMWPIAWFFSSDWTSFSTSIGVERILYRIQLTITMMYLVIGGIIVLMPRSLSQSLTHQRSAVSKGKKTKTASVSESEAVPHGEGGQRLASPPRGARLALWLCGGAACLQVHYAFTSWIAHNFLWSTLMEYGLQIAIPISCALMLPNISPRWEGLAEQIVRLGVSFCFIGHGLYALGYAPTPGGFVTMTMNILPLSEAGAEQFLQLIGALDLCAALLLWLPIYELKRAALIYMVIWGGMTALARPLGQPSATMIDAVIVWGPEFIWRTSHALAPLWLWLRAFH